MFKLAKIPTLAGPPLNVIPLAHRRGMWPGTMGQDDSTDTTGYDDVSSSNVSATVPVASVPVVSSTSDAGPGITGLTNGVASVLANITPQAQVGILNTITNALGLTKPSTVVYPVGYVAPKSTLSKYLLPAAAAAVVLLLVMHHKK